ncbi:hypothetical protein TNCV_4677901 [Trichonephila clavipes]|nr:hypothetical protein TNCV_4677901 [Trichonephila clavipes]
MLSLNPSWLKRLFVGMVWKLDRKVPAYGSSSSLDCGLKLPDPLSVALECNVNITLTPEGVVILITAAETERKIDIMFVNL